MGSTRLPGKPLADIGGTPMVVHTWRAAKGHPSIDRVCVATDHADIAEIVRLHGGEAVMTSSGAHHGHRQVLRSVEQLGRTGRRSQPSGRRALP